MDAWPRLIACREASPPLLAGAAISLGLGGLQTRNLADVGWVWTEVYQAFNVNSLAGRAFANRIARAWNEGEIFSIVHPDLATPLGAGAAGYTPLVNGAGQCGTSLVTDGWPPSSTVLREGDPIRLGGVPGVYRMRADVAADATGAATLTLDPLILVGSGPADNAPITWTGVPFYAILGEAPDLKSHRAGPSGHIVGLELTFFEALST